MEFTLLRLNPAAQAAIQGEARAARDARAVLEIALDAIGWAWSRRLSLWLDALIRLEEAS